jgi:hypothetical protein
LQRWKGWCAIDPFTLLAAGIGTAGSLAGGIYNAATAGDRKKKWKEEQRREALHQLRRQRAAELGYPVGGDGAYTMDKINRQADEQFKVDPMSFVPFVQNATKLAGGIYDAADGGGGQPQQRMAPDAVARAQQSMQEQQDALERAEAMRHFKGVYGNSYQGYGG